MSKNGRAKVKIGRVESKMFLNNIKRYESDPEWKAEGKKRVLLIISWQVFSLTPRGKIARTKNSRVRAGSNKLGSMSFTSNKKRSRARAKIGSRKRGKSLVNCLVATFFSNFYVP